MDELAAMLARSAATILAAMLILWVISVAVRDASIVDIFWGPGFVLVAVVGFVSGEASDARRALMLVLVGVWGLRLGLHLAVRNIGRGEDARYQAMRRRAGPAFWWRSLYIVFAFQGVMMWVVSLPVQASMAGGGDPGGLAFAGAAVWLIGIAFEAVGDLQLRRFKADPANSGQVMDRGLWRYTRHPNYFGDALLWWGIWLVAAGAPWGWATFVGPVAMSFLLTRLSGVPMLERRMARTRPGYREYMERTSAFVPLPPRRPRRS